MPPFAKYELLNEYQRMQDDAMEDDWRVGKIESYLKSLSRGETVCAVQLFSDCLYPDSPVRPKNSDSRAIGQIMAKMDGWERCGVLTTDKFGKQRCWKKTGQAEPIDIASLPSDLPF